MAYEQVTVGQAIPLIVVAIGSFFVVQELRLALLGLVALALIIPINIPTGTDVVLNPSVIIIPGLFGLWLLSRFRRHLPLLEPSTLNKPFIVFIGAGFISLLIGQAMWDPSVPRENTFILVQFAQWGIFILSFAATWIMGHYITDEVWLKRITFTFILIGGTIAFLKLFPYMHYRVFPRYITIVFTRAPFWIALLSLSLGQLLFNRKLPDYLKLLMVLSIIGITYNALTIQRESASIWVSLVAATGVLCWLRWPKLRVPIVMAGATLLLSGTLLDFLWAFAGGEEEWFESGGSRLTLILRVIDMTMRNPITGLGPAAYRPYGILEPLIYEHIIWYTPLISSHNNYVDIFSHMGIVGLILFAWIAIRIGFLCVKLHIQVKEGFLAGYVNAVTAMGVACLVVMLFGDWVLPFVYNIGFPGFQASFLVWLFLGGLLTIEKMIERGDYEP
ncbi:MAG TPA: O-antigen ligase family protein [Anaerolineae bacterium]|nr:O-antigen ligase family protein [Anaerolineae bacterium]